MKDNPPPRPPIRLLASSGVEYNPLVERFDWSIRRIVLEGRPHHDRPPGQRELSASLNTPEGQVDSLKRHLEKPYREALARKIAFKHNMEMVFHEAVNHDADDGDEEEEADQAEGGDDGDKQRRRRSRKKKSLSRHRTASLSFRDIQAASLRRLLYVCTCVFE